MTAARAHDEPDEREPDVDDVAHDDDPIEVSTDERAMADETVRRLAAREERLFHRAGQLVTVRAELPDPRVLLRHEPTPRICALTRANLRESISAHVEFVRGDGREAGVPDLIVRAIHERGEWPELRRLRAITDAPVLRADGSIASTPGYDAATELLVLPTHDYPAVPDRPTRAHVDAAREALLECIVDFPMERDEHRSAWLAAVLTMFARPAYHGPCPLLAIDKNVRGAGGTLLADSVGFITTGQALPRMSAARDPDEERKRITSLAISGDRIVLIDNVAGTLGSEHLDAALTATTWRDRVLGSSVIVTLPLEVTWIATGNGLVLGADTIRRVMPIRIVAQDERPEERTGFAHPDLLAWLRAERPRLVVAALTILRGYCAAGRPNVGLIPWGSYEAWSSIVRAAVVWCGMPDPAHARQELASTADSEANALRDVLRAWRDLYGDRGASVAEMLRDLSGGDTRGVRRMPSADQRALRAALLELCPLGGSAKPDALPTARAVSARLRRMRDRVVGGLAMSVRDGRTKSGERLYVRELRSAKGDEGDRGDELPPSELEKINLEQGQNWSLQSPSSPPTRRVRARRSPRTEAAE